MSLGFPAKLDFDQISSKKKKSPKNPKISTLLPLPLPLPQNPNENKANLACILGNRIR